MFYGKLRCIMPWRTTHGAGADSSKVLKSIPLPPQLTIERKSLWELVEKPLRWLPVPVRSRDQFFSRPVRSNAVELLAEPPALRIKIFIPRLALHDSDRVVAVEVFGDGAAVESGSEGSGEERGVSL